MTIFYHLYDGTKNDYIKGDCNYEKNELLVMYARKKVMENKKDYKIETYKSKDYLTGYIFGGMRKKLYNRSPIRL